MKVNMGIKKQRIDELMYACFFTDYLVTIRAG